MPKYKITLTTECRDAKEAEQLSLGLKALLNISKERVLEAGALQDLVDSVEKFGQLFAQMGRNEGKK
jgi:hypothetical protein